MPKRIPIKAARAVADAYPDVRQVILFAFDDDGRTHVVTYGRSVEDCDQAAQGAEYIKRDWGWPERLAAAKPSRVRKLEARIAELEAELAAR